MRQVILDTETTGLEAASGHRVIEIGAVEVRERRLTGRHFHQYLKPDRAVDPGAYEVHGISDEFLADKPPFESIAEEFLEFVAGAEVIIHNAPFDVGFLDSELQRLERPERIGQICTVTDSLMLARKRHPGQRNSLDALCKRYNVDNSNRTLHGALLDAEILADVYLAMTGGQLGLALAPVMDAPEVAAIDNHAMRGERSPLRVVLANPADQQSHHQYLEMMAKQCETVLWPVAADQSENGSSDP